jgi:glutathione synthase/RimK-type ligase-like ATP-grasp enzyme
VILAVTHRDDEHARPVLEALARQGAEAVVLDLALLPARGRLALAYGEQGSPPARPGSRRIHLDGADPLDLSRTRAVWWRRPQDPRAPRGLTAARAAFAERQTLEALGGLLASLEGARFVNHPWLDDAATLKTLQLAAAERAGLTVPPTLVTNDPAAARAFLGRWGRGGAVHKALHATREDWRRTARVEGGRAAILRELRAAPVILQERIPGVDVRVTVVGDELFAADVDARRSPSPDDYRGFEDHCRFTPCRLPAAVEAGLRRLLADLGLSFAAADFRRGADGAWHFLEVNPAGQWLWVERRTGQPITAALAALLAAGVARRRRRRTG